MIQIEVIISIKEEAVSLGIYVESKVTFVDGLNMKYKKKKLRTMS